MKKELLFLSPSQKPFQKFEEEIDSKNKTVFEDAETICSGCQEPIEPYIDYSNGYMICQKCGCVQNQIVIEKKLPRSFQNQQIQKQSYSVEDVIYKKKAYSSSFMKSPAIAKYYNLMKVNDYYDMKEKKEKTIYDFLRFIANFCAIDKDTFLLAFKSYKTLEKQDIVKGKRLYAVVGVVLDHACKEQRKLITLNEISLAIQQYMPYKFSEKDIPRIRGDVSRLKKQLVYQGYRFEQTLSPASQIKKICYNIRNYNTLPIPIVNTIEVQASKLLDALKDHLRFFGNLGSFAPAFVLYATEKNNYSICHTVLAKLSSYTPPTIQTHYNNMLKVIKKNPAIEKAIFS